MPVLKVVVYDTSVHKRKTLICASDSASLPESRKAMAAVVSRFDTLDKIRATSSLIILDIRPAKVGKDYSTEEWQSSRKNLAQEDA
jgi:hypothetical protein